MEHSEIVAARHASPVRAILFDFDGTLFELKVDWLKVRQELKKLLKFPGSAKDFKPLKPRIQEIIKRLRDNDSTTLKVEKIEQQAYEIISKHEIKGAEEGYPHEGAKEILEWCQDQGTRVVILTRNTRSCVFPVLEKYQWPQPELIVGREDVEKEKPDPESGLLVLQNLNLQPEDCLIVGDSLPDMLLAKNLGIKSVLYYNPRHKVIPKEHADHFIKNLLELKDIV